MKIIQAGICFPKYNWEDIIKTLERYARVCYRSENIFDKLKKNDFIKKLIKNKHESILEHEKVTCLFITDRGVTHEIVRHRLASYSQESTRYCNYSKDKFGKEITLIKPIFFKKETYEIWKKTMNIIEKKYFELLDKGSTPEEARSILPNSLKTEIVVTMNLRSLRHFLELRCSKIAHPQIKEISIPLLLYLKDKANVLFDDIAYDKEFKAIYYGFVKETDNFFKEVN